MKSRIVTAALLPLALLAAGTAGIYSAAASDGSAASRPATAYYVSGTGADDAEGSFGRPFRSINRALAEARAGDTVFVRGGTYRETVEFPSSGLPDRPIVLKAYGDETPLISGEGMAWQGRLDLVHIGGRSHIAVEGFEIAWLETATAACEANGITVDAGATDIILRGNRIHHIRNTAPRDGYPSAHAILVIGNTADAMRRITIERNRIHDCVTGTSESVTVNGYVDGFAILDNEIYRCSNIAVDAAGGYSANGDPQLNYARNGLIAGNTIYDIDNELGQLAGNCGAIAIYADGSRDIVIERNRILRCDRGIGIVSETDAYPTTGCIVRNNLVGDCRRTGIYMGGYLGYTGGGTERCAVVNNTLYRNNRTKGAFGETEGELRLTENCRDNLIANNLVCATDPDDLFVHKYTSTGGGNRFENNIYSGPAGWLWERRDGEPLTSLDAWREASGGDAEALHTVRPTFDFEPDAGSDFSVRGTKAKNAGKVLHNGLNGAADLDGNPRTVRGKVSIGALQ